MSASIKHFGVFFDLYYWKAALLIAKNGLARQYRNSYLGLLWTLFQPLAMVMIYTLVMPMIMKNAVPNYSLYMIISLPTWGFFVQNLFGASQSILNNGDTLKRCMISSTVFPAADVIRNTYVYFIALATMYAVAVLFLSAFDPIIFIMPLFFIPILMIIGSLSIAIAFLAPYVRDIGDLIMISMNMMFWLTPVVYSIDVLPPWAQSLMHWNPFYIMLRPLQLLAYNHVMPGMDDIARLLLLTLVAIIVGFSIFRACRRNYVYYL